MVKSDAPAWPQDKQKQLEHLEQTANKVRHELQSG
jgi:hypothetical protein